MIELVFAVMLASPGQMSEEEATARDEYGVLQMRECFYEPRKKEVPFVCPEDPLYEEYKNGNEDSSDNRAVWESAMEQWQRQVSSGPGPLKEQAQRTNVRGSADVQKYQISCDSANMTDKGRLHECILRSPGVDDQIVSYDWEIQPTEDGLCGVDRQGERNAKTVTFTPQCPGQYKITGKAYFENDVLAGESTVDYTVIGGKEQSELNVDPKSILTGAGVGIFVGWLLNSLGGGGN